MNLIVVRANMKHNNKENARRLKLLVDTAGAGIEASVTVHKHDHRSRLYTLTEAQIEVARATIANLQEPVTNEQAQEVYDRMHRRRVV